MQQAASKKSVICIDPDEMSVVIVQVKNFQSGSSDSRDGTRDRLNPIHAVADFDKNGRPYIGIWMQMADINNQVDGVQNIPLLGTSTRSTELKEEMLGMITDGISTKTFPFLDELPSMGQAAPGTCLDDFN